MAMLKTVKGSFQKIVIKGEVKRAEKVAGVVPAG
jgi:hypothetical protein